MIKPCTARHRMALSKAAAFLALLLAFTLTSAPARTEEQLTPAQLSSLSADIPISPIERAEKDGTAYHLSLKDVTKLALQNNLSIAISDTNEELYQKRTLQAYGPYDPAITIRPNYQSSISANTNKTNESQGNTNLVATYTWNFGLTQNIPTGGGYSVSFNSNKTTTNQIFSLFNPQYSTAATFSFTQPLLRNRRIDQNRGTIKIYNLDVKISDSQFKQTVTNTIASIQGSYWNLVYAVREYDIVKEAVNLARVTVNNNKEQVRIGVLAPIEITVAQASLASQMLNLSNARQAIIVAENNLLSLLSSDRNAEIWHKVIVPTDSADFVEYKVDLDQAIDTALAKRPELEQIDLQLQETDVNYRVTSDQRKWQFDFQGSLGYTGVAGPNSITPGLAGGVGTAYNALFTQGFRNWLTGFNISIPLRNRTVESELGQLQIQKKSALLNRKNTELSIAVQVRNAYQGLITAQQNIETSKIARELAELQLDGDQKRFQAGMVQNFLVLQDQVTLEQDRGAELQALISYKQAVITLQQYMYTLLESGDFAIAGSGSSSKPPQFK